MQADPRPHSYTRPPCAVCGTGARLAHKHWCGACQQAYLDKENARTHAEWLSTQSYAAPRAQPVPVPARGAPVGTLRAVRSEPVGGPGQWPVELRVLWVRARRARRPARGAIRLS